MLSLTLAVSVATALGLLFDSTRWLGVAGAALLCLLHPAGFFLLLLVAGVGLCFFHLLWR